MLQLPNRAAAMSPKGETSLEQDWRIERDCCHARAYREMEGPICDIANMAQIAYQRVFDVLADVREGRTFDPSTYDPTEFAVSHLEEMIATLRRDYYENFESKQGK